MKRRFTCILAVLTLLSALATPAFAAGNGYTDADGDGICDNRTRHECFIDEDRDGICDNRDSGRGFGLCRRSDNGTLFPCRRDDDRPRVSHDGSGRREHFVDENEDGICDNRCRGNGNGRGRQQGKNK